MLEVGNSILGQMSQIVLYLLDILLDLLNLVIGLVRIVTRDTDKLKLCQTLDILKCNLATKQTLEWIQALIHRSISLLA